MQLKEIREIVSDILDNIENNQLKLTHRKYETFFDRIGMSQRRNFDTLSKFDYQFKKNNITIWAGKEPVKKLEQFPKWQTITFRLSEIESKPSKVADENKMKVSFAGTVTVEQCESGIEPYKHQEEAFYSLHKNIIQSNKNPFAGLLVLPTGGGKTLTASHWIAKNIIDKNKKVLWIAHRHELLEQAQKTFAEKLAFSDIFASKKSFNYRIISGIHDKPVNIRPSDDIIISSKDSLNAGFNHLYNNWIKNNTDEIFLVIDEAHHATAKTYRKLIANLKEKISQFKMLGLTATPFRTAEDEQGMLKKVFPDDIIYKIDLRTLIRLGILSEPHFEEVSTGQNFIEQFDLTEKQIKELNLKFGDFNTILGENISHSIAINKERNLTIVKRYIAAKNKYKQTIVFAMNVDNAIALNALFREAGIKSDYVISNVKDANTGSTTNFTKENIIKVENFRKGIVEVLINVNILTEGTDIPNVQSVFLARPTISSILMTQMIGRGLRGPKAGGTKDAYIVSFIDEWQNKISWVNPEKLFIEENIDFDDKTLESRKQILRLVAINKIEEFAILNNQIIDPHTKNELEKLDFIERFPVGIYQFKFLKETNGEAEDRRCEILVYDNIQQSYNDFVNGLESLFVKFNLNNKDFLTDDELDYYSKIIENKFFDGCLKYPAYHIQDIKDVLQYYSTQNQVPPFVELKDRDKYNIDAIAQEIIEQDFGEKAQKEMIDEIWISDEIAWQTFFNFDKKNFLREISLSKTKHLNPELYMKKSIIPKDEKELRALENLSLYQIKESNPVYGKWLSDEVYKKFTDKNGLYYCANSGYKSKNKLDFQIDHIKSMHNGGLTIIENLQLLTRSENAKKGNKD